MDQSDEFLKDISTMLRDTESLLMDFDMAPAAAGPRDVINLDDSVVNLTSTEEEPSPYPSRRRARNTRGIRRRNANPSTTTSLQLQAIVDLCNSPMGPPASTTQHRPQPTTGRTRTAGRRANCRPANHRYSSDEAETINLDDSIVELPRPGPSFSTARANPSPAADTSLSDGSGPSCPICLGSWTSPVSTMCGHIFCKQCIAQWVKVEKKCPICKAGGSKLKTHPIFIS